MDNQSTSTRSPELDGGSFNILSSQQNDRGQNVASVENDIDALLGDDIGTFEDDDEDDAC